MPNCYIFSVQNVTYGSTDLFWLCMDKVMLVFSNSTLTFCGSSWWNWSTAAVWMNESSSHSTEENRGS